MTGAADRTNSITTTTTPTTPPLLPVGIFIDLDNIAWKTYSRADARKLVDPLQHFGARIGGEIKTMQGFGNFSTRTFHPAEEVARLKHHVVFHDDDDEENEFRMWEDPMFDPEKFHTGYDKNGVLRCGICGAKMKLSKKERQMGWDEYRKLDKHMRMLHDREEAKRQNRRKTPKEKGLSKSERLKSKKYWKAQVDTGRKTHPNSQRNQLFQVLREVGVDCVSSEDVDSTLIEHAEKWMNREFSKPYIKEVAASRVGMERGCLIVVSNDADFVDLLRLAKQKNIIAVSVSLNDAQTRYLESESDLVLYNGGKTAPRPISRRGGEFIADCEQRWSREHPLQPSDSWETGPLQ